MGAARNTVIVADDHPLIGVALRLSVLAVDPAIDVVEVSTFSALKQAMADSETIQLVLLDLMMPDVEGLSALQFLRTWYPQAPVAIVSGIQERTWLRAAEALGAVAFVPKSTNRKLLQDIIRQLLNGGSWWPQPDSPTSDTIDVSEADDRLDRLTRQEMRILLQIKDGQLNKQIAYDLGIRESTVKTHIGNLLVKLDLRSRTQAAVLAQKLLTAQPERAIQSASEKSSGSAK